MDLIIPEQSPISIDPLVTPSLPAKTTASPGSPSYLHEQKDPKTAMSSWLSPYGISFASVLAVLWKVLSRLPCLTSRSKMLDSAWPLRSIRITRLHRYFGPLRHPLAFGPFPVSTVIGPTSLQGFLLGASRTSPVSIASLLPCRRHYPAGVDYPLSQTEIVHTVFTAF